jgi:hypothetical protein
MTNIEIGISCSPSKIIQSELINVTKVVINYGDNSDTYYCNNISDSDSNIGFVDLHLYNGELVSVNPSFIVKQQDSRLVYVISDITDHINYHTNTCNKCIQHEYIELYYGETYSIVDSYVARHNGDLSKRIVKTYKVSN